MLSRPMIDRIAFLGISWYAILIVSAILIGLVYCRHEAHRLDIPQDTMIDFFLYAIPLAIVFARIYYVVFRFNMYSEDLMSIFNIRQGGLAIYGGIIGGLIAARITASKHDVPMLTLLDIVAPALVLGQGIGRWGNYINMEAFGAETDWFLRMGLLNTSTGEVEYHHPTILYESVWNLIGFVILHFASKKRKYDGQIALGYVAWYGFGRTVIEALRTDSLYWGQFRVSQLLAAVSCLAAAIVLTIQYFKPHDKENLFVNRVAAAAAAEVTEEIAEEPAEEAAEETAEATEE